jgi:anti-sigma B factor antagonist
MGAESHSPRSVGVSAELRWADRSATVTVNGEVLSDCVHTLASRIDEAVRAGAQAIVVDLAGATRLDTAGVRALIDGRRVAVARRVGYAVVNGPGQTMPMLRVPVAAELL